MVKTMKKRKKYRILSLKNKIGEKDNFKKDKSSKKSKLSKKNSNKDKEKEMK